MAAEPTPNEDPKVARFTRDDLDKYIGEAVEKAVSKRFDGMNDRLDGLRKDLLGDDKAERTAVARDKSRSDFEQMGPAERAGVMKRFKSSLFSAATRGVQGIEKLPWMKDAGDDVQEPIGSGALFTRVVPLLIRAKGNWERAATYAEEGGNKALADFIRKTLTAGDFDAGGSQVPELVSADFIGFLYAASVIRRMGARTIDLSERGNITLGRLNATATAYWIGEVDAITASQETFGQLKLDLKKLGVFVPISEDLIKWAVGDMVEIVRDDTTMVAALKEDLAMIRGDGTANQPKGLRYWAHSDNVFGSAGTSYANTITDLIKAQYKLEVANVPTPDPKWLSHPRTLLGLIEMRDTSGDSRPWFFEYAMNGTIEGSEFFKTTQIPVNLGGGTNESELYYVEPSQMVIGEGMQLEIEESNVASYVDSGAATRHAFQRFEHVIRLGHQVDFAIRHNKAVAVVSDTTLGDSLD